MTATLARKSRDSEYLQDLAKEPDRMRLFLENLSKWAEENGQRVPRRIRVGYWCAVCPACHKEMTVERWGHRGRPVCPTACSLGDIAQPLGVRLREYEGQEPLQMVPVEKVARQSVSWLWQDRIPAGRLSIIMGDPGVGKTGLCCDLAARISNGKQLPGGSEDRPRNVLFYSAEDSTADTLRPRFEDAGGDVSRIFVLSEDSETFDLDKDIDRISDTIQSYNPALVVFDPISCFMGEINPWKNEDVRAMIRPLAAVALEFSTAIILVHHLNKQMGQSAIYRASGAPALVAASRAAWLLTEDEMTSDRRILLHVKNNLSRQKDGLAFSFNPNGTLAWESKAVQETANEHLGDLTEKRTSLEEAQTWLESYLSEGASPADAVKRASRAQGISPRTLDRAKKDLSVISRKEGSGHGSQWVWALPDKYDPDPIPDPITEEDRLRCIVQRFKERSTAEGRQDPYIPEFGDVRLSGDPESAPE